MKKQVLLGGVAALLLILALVLLFRDSIFPASAPKTSTDPKLTEAAATTAATVAPTDAQIAPSPANPPPRGSGKKPVGVP